MDLLQDLAIQIRDMELAVMDQLPPAWRSLVHDYGDLQGVLLLRDHGYTAQAARHIFEDTVQKIQQKETKL